MLNSVIPIEMGNADPREGEDVPVEVVAVEDDSIDRLMTLAGFGGNLAEAMSAADLAEIGAECIDDYEQDKADRKDWADTAEEALEAAAQVWPNVSKDSPWKGAANVRWPLLTEAVLQFNARMYPAVVKGDEAVSCKVIGKDVGQPVMDQNGQIVPMMGPEGPVMGPDGQPQPMWRVQPGAKSKRAERVSTYLNTVLFYREIDWEGDTDMMLVQLPAVGCAFRKRWMVDGESKSALVSALRIVVPEGAKSCETTPRLTEEVPDVYPHVYSEAVRSGRYLDYDDMWSADDRASSKPRMFLEQHRLMDLDEDGVDEPYIVILDHETRRVLRIEANFGPDDVKRNGEGKVLSIAKGKFYVKYPFFPHPQGKFYDLGLGHLLKQLGEVANTLINQMLDAGTAQTAGGGFIGSGIRLQGRGSRSVVRFSPGEYKTVDVTGDQLRAGIVERTLPNVSPVSYQILEMILGAAKGLTGIQDIMTGEASNNGQVGTTLALIEQGMQIFNATVKRVFRSLKQEYTLLKDNIREFATEATKQDYLDVLDDPEADFDADFAAKDMDIRPVSDPSSVTRMQKMARAQFLMGTLPTVMQLGGDGREIMRRVYEAADIEDIDKIFPPPAPAQPNPLDEAKRLETEAKAKKAFAESEKIEIETAHEGLKAQTAKFNLEREAVIEGANLASIG